MNAGIFIILLSFFLWPYFVYTITVSVKQELTQYLFLLRSVTYTIYV